MDRIHANEAIGLGVLKRIRLQLKNTGKIKAHDNYSSHGTNVHIDKMDAFLHNSIHDTLLFDIYAPPGNAGFRLRVRVCTYSRSIRKEIELKGNFDSLTLVIKQYEKGVNYVETIQKDYDWDVLEEDIAADIMVAIEKKW